MMLRVRLAPFSPASVDAVVAFCVANGPYDAPLLRRLMLGLTSAPAGVLVVEDRGGPVLVAAVVDRTTNGAGAANLELLGVRGPVASEVFARCVVEPALAFARGGERRALQVPLGAIAAEIVGAEAVLRAAGFAHAYDSVSMARAADAPEPPAPLPLAAGWSWETLDAARAPQAHDALVEIFRDAASTSVPPLVEFRQSLVTGGLVWRVLLDGQRIAGLVQVVSRGDRGDLRVVGRTPAYRGVGIGPRLISEALRVLRAAGARGVSLEVEARNEDALALYRRFGFEVATRAPTFARPLSV
jgi:ribosomal protein S18 acetylase RimI-like enzyme